MQVVYSMASMKETLTKKQNIEFSTKYQIFGVHISFSSSAFYSRAFVFAIKPALYSATALLTSFKVAPVSIGSYNLVLIYGFKV